MMHGVEEEKNGNMKSGVLKLNNNNNNKKKQEIDFEEEWMSTACSKMVQIALKSLDKQIRFCKGYNQILCGQVLH